MPKDVLDHSEDFEDNYDNNTKIVTAKFFYFESQARLYEARLREAGIPSFLSNTNTSTVLAFGEGGIGLNVKETDLDAALEIIQLLDINAQKESTEENFRDADKAEILYQKQIRESHHKNWSSLTIVALIFVVLLIIRAFLRAAGLVGSWRDFF